MVSEPAAARRPIMMGHRNVSPPPSRSCKGMVGKDARACKGTSHSSTAGTRLSDEVNAWVAGGEGCFTG